MNLFQDDKPGKLARLIPQDTIIGTWADFERAQADLDAEVRSAWENKWDPPKCLPHFSHSGA
jgi:hypothetical protein